MPSTSLTAKMVMDKSASLMNDTARTEYTYDAQLPYLQMALDELQEQFELNNIPSSNSNSAAITVPIGSTAISPVDGINPGAAPNYPQDLVEIQMLWERLSGSSEPYVTVGQVDFLPHNLDDLPVATLQYWAWEGQVIRFIPATTARQVKIDYIGKLFPSNITTEAIIGLINARSYLQYRTAALCSQYIGENPTRAESLNGAATDALDRIIGIGTKGRQSMPVRRRPFMSSYKRRTFI